MLHVRRNGQVRVVLGRFREKGGRNHGEEVEEVEIGSEKGRSLRSHVSR